MGSCTSRSRQSPIDLPTPPASIGSFSYKYLGASTPFEIANNGHTLFADFAGLGYGGITYDNVWYDLLNINVHAKSEHTVRGRHTPIELHLVHKRYDSDALLIVAIPVNCTSPPPDIPEDVPPTSSVFLQSAVVTGEARRTALTSAVSGGIAQSVLAQVGGLRSSRQVPVSSSTPASDLPYTPPAETDPNFNPAVQAFLKVEPPPVNMKGIVPGDEVNPLELNPLLGGETFYDYAGSMTAPPCVEIVRWLVRSQPVIASDAQVWQLHDRIYKMTADFGNYRAVMPLNGREIIMRQSVMEDRPPVQVVVPSIPTAHQTNRELRSMKWAKDALHIAQSSASYIKDLDMRLRRAAEAHANALAPQEMSSSTVGPATVSQTVSVTPHIDLERTAIDMAHTIGEAAKQAIADASRQIESNARITALDAARQAAQMVMSGALPVGSENMPPELVSWTLTTTPAASVIVNQPAPAPAPSQAAAPAPAAAAAAR